MGVELSGTVNGARPGGRLRREASAAVGDVAYFAPLITNDTGRPLRVTVNAGLQGAMPCHCTITAGAVRMMIGYYPLFQNSTVQVIDARGRSATFTALGPQVEDRLSGAVGLKFEAANLR